MKAGAWQGLARGSAGGFVSALSVLCLRRCPSPRVQGLAECRVPAQPCPQPVPPTSAPEVLVGNCLRLLSASSESRKGKKIASQPAGLLGLREDFCRHRAEGFTPVALQRGSEEQSVLLALAQLTPLLLVRVPRRASRGGCTLLSGTQNFPAGPMLWGSSRHTGPWYRHWYTGRSL